MKMNKKYHFDCCEHNKHEYAGSLENFQDFGPVDVYFLDSSGGHNEGYHGYCIRYGIDGEYLSLPMVYATQSKPEIWELYLNWCDKLGYEPQTWDYLKEKFPGKFE